jgi:hypothetical protein
MGFLTRAYATSPAINSQNDFPDRAVDDIFNRAEDWAESQRLVVLSVVLVVLPLKIVFKALA